MLYTVLALPPGRNDVQFRFLDAERVPMGAGWSGVGISEQTDDGTPLGYSVDTTAPALARYIVWRVAAYPSIVAEEDLAGGALTPTQAAQLASAAEDADALRTRFDEQVPEPTPLIVRPASTSPGMVRVFAEPLKAGMKRKDATLRAKLKGRAPFRVKGVFVEALLTAKEAAFASTTDADGLLTLELYKSSEVQDANGDSPCPYMIYSADLGFDGSRYYEVELENDTELTTIIENGEPPAST